MKNLNTLQKALIAGVVVAAFGLAGCEADGNGLESGGIIGDGSDNGGLTLRGAKMLATSGIMANEVFVSCIQPLRPGDEKYAVRSEEHTSELHSLMRISYAVFCLTKKPTIHSSNQIIILK